MKDDQNDQATVDSRPTYESPRALRLADMHAGSGGVVSVCEPGSGDLGDCASSGNSAGFGCNTNGNNAGAVCTTTGSGVVNPI